MGIVMAGLSPHPPIIIPEIGGERREEIRDTINSLEELANEIVNLKPDLVITISPHGPVFTDAISILEQEEIKGDFGDFGYPNIGMEVKTNAQFIDKLKQQAVDREIEVITLTPEKLRNYRLDATLDHGVLVPLYFLKEADLAASVTPITMGLLDYQQLYEFGYLIQETVEQMGIKAVVVASGDLSHRLKPGAPAGYNPRGQEFDEKLIELLKNKDYQSILNFDQKLIEKAGECGLRPLIIMLGALRDLNCSVDVKSYEGPFGVGYGVVGFYPDKEGS